MATPAESEIRKILVAIDGSKTSVQVLDTALDLCSRFNQHEFYILRVYKPKYKNQAESKAQEELKAIGADKKLSGVSHVKLAQRVKGSYSLSSPFSHDHPSCYLNTLQSVKHTHTHKHTHTQMFWLLPVMLLTERC